VEESAVDADAGDDEDDKEAWADTRRTLPNLIADSDEVEAAAAAEEEVGWMMREATDPCRLWRECLAEPADGMVGTRYAVDAPIAGGGGSRGSGVAGSAEVDRGDVDEDENDEDDDEGDNDEKKTDGSRRAGGGEAGSGRARGPGWPANEGMPSEMYE
jgi:hypothetical protein